MPDVSRMMRVVAVTVLAIVATASLHAQQDSATVRDSVMRADSIRADSVRADSIRRSELARIRAEPRAIDRSGAGVAATNTPSESGAMVVVPTAPHFGINAASVTADMIADLSPK